MKRFAILTILTLAAFANATVYNVEDGDWHSSINLSNSDKLFMDGGEVRSISSSESAYALIEGGDTRSIFAGGQSLFNISGGNTIDYRSDWYANLNMNGGSINEVLLESRSTAHFSGGQIGTLESEQNLELIEVGFEQFVVAPRIHFYGYGFDYTSNILSGYWEGGEAFSVTLIDDPAFATTYENIELHIVPEPITFALLGFGFFFAKKRIN